MKRSSVKGPACERVSPHDPCLTEFLNRVALPAMRRRLKAWYGRHARDLPWRRTRDPYAIWISEIMLQQTTVAAVVPFYERFLAAFPTVFALAGADEHDVLKLWEGLGYYSRGRNLHRAAQVLVHEHGGEFPGDATALQALPGIGRYTAGAIASFAFDARAPIVEANTLRLYSRLLGYRGDPRSADGQALLWDFAEGILPQRDSGRLNQALMELGATVCTPTAPQCATCPLQRDCGAFREGLQGEIPPAKPRAQVTHVLEAAVAIERRGRYLLRQRGAEERWAGMWDFPRIELQVGTKRDCSSGASPKVRAAVERRLAESTGLTARIDSLVTDFSHSVTRYRIRLLCFRARHRAGTIDRNGRAWRWVRASDFRELALSVSGRRFAGLLAAIGTNGQT
mgnify:FL=1